MIVGCEAKNRRASSTSSTRACVADAGPSFGGRYWHLHLDGVVLSRLEVDQAKARALGVDSQILGNTLQTLLLNMLSRIALIPVIAGLSYEVIRAAGKKESGAIFRLMTLPGIWLQNLTTREPSDDQLEVAICALKESLKLEPQTAEASA